jgi:hypothetical protein
MIAARFTRYEAVTLSAVAALIAFQLFIPPVVGMADNGDFAKVAARLCMQPPPPLLNSDQRYWHFSFTEYEVAPQHCLVFWQWSSMSALAWVAKQIHDVVDAESHFDIRAVGAVCTVAWLSCLWGVLRLLRSAPALVKGVAAGLAVIVLTDVLYIAYFNSFYGDCAAMIFLFATCLTAWRAARRPAPAAILGFAATACLLVWSKGPHILIAPWLIGFACFWWWRSHVRAWGLSAALVLLATVTSLWSVPKDYAAGTTFNVIFARLVPTAAAPTQVLAAFGLPPEAVRYAGEYVYTATTPYNEPGWRARYADSLAPQRLALFYVRNPGVTFRSLWHDLRASSNMRIFAYYRTKGRRQPDRPVRSLGGWSDLRAWLLRSAPWHMPLFYTGILIGGAVLTIRGRRPWQVIGGSLSVALAGAGLSEFTATSLFDALETDRHLFMFHVLTDALVVHVALGGAWLADRYLATRRGGGVAVFAGPAS